MVKQIVTQTTPQNQKPNGLNHRQKVMQRPRRFPDGCDPYRRLLAAVALLAVLDIVRPPANLEDIDLISAREFVLNCPEVYRALGIPDRKIKAVLVC